MASLLFLAPLAAGCDSTSKSDAAQSTSTPSATVVTDDDALRARERDHGARVGLFAVDTGTGRTLGYRQDERFTINSTFKPLA
ncbi:hypothetical protein [Nocardia seriolae]|nr:hypothetical protein [Nocardia seriolae]WKY53955.1 hypothetical protein Q5P07_07720 [Nocardia seriolae]WNJ60731.1 hypothetical protein RMO66_08445 [Nocardia seriolae]